MDLSYVISYVILFFSVQYLRSICMHGAVPLASLSHLFCLHWGLFNGGREHRHAIQHTWDDGQRHCGHLRRETPGPSVRFSRGRHSHILTCAMWLMGKFCVQKGPGAGHWDGERMCMCLCVCLLASSQGLACAPSIQPTWPYAAGPMSGRGTSSNRRATTSKIWPISSLHSHYTARRTAVF